MNEPEKYLWKNTPCDTIEMRNIFYSISLLEYHMKPDYDYIRTQLMSILRVEKQKELAINSFEANIHLGGKRKLTTVSKLIKESFNKYLAPDIKQDAKRSHPPPIFKIEKVSISLKMPLNKDLFKIVIDEEYYKSIYGNYIV